MQTIGYILLLVLFSVLAFWVQRNFFLFILAGCIASQLAWEFPGDVTTNMDVAVSLVLIGYTWFCFLKAYVIMFWMPSPDEDEE